MNIQHDFDLSRHNSFAIHCRARNYCHVSSNQELLQGLGYASEHQLPVLVLGGGSNVLFTRDFPGLVMHMQLAGIVSTRVSDSRVELQIGAGEIWHDLVMYSLNKKLYGIENLALIPGTVGAAPIQNIGAYGVELSESFVGLEAIEIATGKNLLMNRGDCEFGYRDSIFKRSMAGKAVITSVKLGLSKEGIPQAGYGALQEELNATNHRQALTPERIATAVMAIRRRKLPNPDELPNAGSFFKNPLISREHFAILRQNYGEVPHFEQPGDKDSVKVPAAWFLDQAGWKGYRQGAVGVHEQQAVVIVNHGGASGAEVLSLARSMQDSTRERFAVELEPEVRII